MSTPIPLWMALAIFFTALAFSSLQEWFGSQYEVTRKGWRPAVTRRWYGPHAHVTLRAEADACEPDRFKVLAWDDEHTPAPWLTVQRLDPEYITWLDEDAEAFRAPVTDFAPYAVRRFRPGLTFVRRIPVPWLWQYPLLPFRVRVPREVSEAA